MTRSEIERRTACGDLEDHPDAPIYPEAPERQPGREQGREHSEKAKRQISESMGGGDA